MDAMKIRFVRGLAWIGLTSVWDSILCMKKASIFKTEHTHFSKFSLFASNTIPSLLLEFGLYSFVEL